MFGTLVHDLQRTEEGRLRHFFLRRLRNAADAADATQETFLRLLSSSPRQEIENPTAYLFRTAHNIAVDQTRALKRKDAIECPITDEDAIRNIASDEPSPEKQVIDRQQLSQFEAALLDLPERARTVLLLNRKEGWSYPEIARHLGVSPNTVYNDARMAMAHCMQVMARLNAD